MVVDDDDGLSVISDGHDGHGHGDPDGLDRDGHDRNDHDCALDCDYHVQWHS